MRGEEMCVLPPSPRNLHPGKCERAFSMFSSDGSRLSHLDFVFMTLFLLLLPPHQCIPPITCSLYFLLWNNLCSLYPICQRQAFLVLLPMLLCSLCIWICDWEQRAANRVHLFSLARVDTTAGPPPVSCTTSIYKAFTGFQASQVAQQ